MSVFGVSPRSIVESILVHQTFLVDPSAKRNKLDKGVHCSCSDGKQLLQMDYTYLTSSLAESLMSMVVRYPE